MPIIRQIEFTGKNLNDIFNLPCVHLIQKNLYSLEPEVVLWESYTRSRAYSQKCLIGDTLVEYDDGKWAIEPPNPQST